MADGPRLPRELNILKSCRIRLGSEFTACCRIYTGAAEYMLLMKRKGYYRI